MTNEYLRFDPSVCMVGQDYQIIFLTSTRGIGWVEVDGVRYDNEEAGMMLWSCVHKITVPGEALNRAGKYTVLFTEYANKKPYFPQGVERVRETYDFQPLSGDDHVIFQFADTHGQVEEPLKTFGTLDRCDLLVLNGDISSSSKDLAQFDTTFALSAGAVHGTRPVVITRGNHDTRGQCAQDMLDYIPTASYGRRRETFYTFRQGNLWGLVLDCGEDKADDHPEYGGVVNFDAFRQRETAFLDALLQQGETEFNAPGVKYRVAFSHVPLADEREEPFTAMDGLYAQWIEKLNQMGVQLMVSGHTHTAFEIPAHNAKNGDPAFPTAVLSIPTHTLPTGETCYVGGQVRLTGGTATAQTVPAAL